MWELPSPPLDDDGALVALPLPAAITKGTKARTSWVSTGALAEVAAYVALERTAAVRGSQWRPDGEALAVTDPDATGGRINGRRVRWASLGLAERLRLVAPDGGACVLGVRADGGPLVDWEYTFAAASRRCRRLDPRFPAVTPHVLRHSFAVNTLRFLVRTHLGDTAKLMAVSGGDPAWALALRAQDPLLVLRDLLGHASVSTTEVYLRMVDTTRLFTDAELAQAEPA